MLGGSITLSLTSTFFLFSPRRRFDFATNAGFLINFRGQFCWIHWISQIFKNWLLQKCHCFMHPKVILISIFQYFTIFVIVCLEF